MSKIWCENCNTAVDEMNIDWKEGYETIDGRTYRNPYEDLAFCPYCGEEFIHMEEPGRCEICLDDCDPNEKICESCKADLFATFEAKADEIAIDLNVEKSLIIEFIDEWLTKRGN